MDVVLFIAVDFGQAVDGMGVDELVVFIQNPLPFCALSVLVLLGPLPSCQGCIPLPSA